METGELLEVDVVGEAQRGFPGEALQQLFEVSLVAGQGQRAGQAPDLHPRLLGGLLAHRHDQTLRLHLGLWLQTKEFWAGGRGGLCCSKGVPHAL